MITTSMTSTIANPIRNSAEKHGAFLLRLALGTVLLSHGLMKIFLFTIPGTVAYFESLGLPAAMAYLTIGGEIAAGIAVLAGVLVRSAALASLPILLGATWAHAANGWVFSNTGGGWEYPLLLAVLAAVVAIQGAGSFALDRVALRPVHAAILRHSSAQR